MCINMCFPLQGIGDTNLAHQCFRLALVHNNHHAEAYNNLAVLEMRKGHIEQVRKLPLLQQTVASFKGKRSCRVLCSRMLCVALESYRPGPESHLCQVLAVWPWPSHFPSLRLELDI